MKYMVNPKIFKAYDIRGVYPEEINEEAAHKIGRAYTLFIKKVSGKDNPQIVIGRDNRNSSPSLFEELKRGIIEEGADVINIGLSTTPILYFSVAEYGSDGGVIVTSSHNPKQYNGFKLVREEAISLSEDTGLGEIRDIVLTCQFEESKEKEKVVKKDPKEDYVKKNISPESFKVKIIVDTANSVSGIVVPEMLKNTELIHIFSELDGDFPNHDPNPTEEENMKALRREVVGKKADLGLTFDGDGDRVLFMDEKGEVVPSDLILALVSSIILRNNLGSKILYDVRCSNIVPETIESLGGRAIQSRVGHSFFKAKMRREDIVFGGEYSGHYYAKYEDKYFFEAPYLTVFSVLEEMKDTGKKLSELIRPFRKYYHSGEINFKAENKEKIMEETGERYKDGKVTAIDGLRIDFEDWWFSLRASNTEPLLKLTVEAKTEELMKEKVEELRAVIQG